MYKNCSEYRCMTSIPGAENYKITEMLLGKDMCKSSSPALCLMQAVAYIHLGMDLLGKPENFVHSSSNSLSTTSFSYSAIRQANLTQL